jgi:hypothetical protein
MAPHKAEFPLIYTIFFTWVDPALSIIGIYAFFAPEFILNSYIPATIPNPAAPGQLMQNPDAVVNPAHYAVYQMLAGFFLLTFTLGAFLLRYTRDVTIWKLYLGSILMVDVVILWATAGAFAQQGRLDPALWRPDDWFSVLATAACAVLRSAFVLGVGLDAKHKTS